MIVAFTHREVRFINYEYYLCVSWFIAVLPTALLNNTSHIPMLSGDNFADWKEQILLTLRCMDLDLALREDEPPALTESSTPQQIAHHEQWVRSNRLSMMLIKAHVNKSIRGSIPECDKVKNLIKAIEEQFVTSDKALASTLMKKLTGLKFDNSKGVREHIMEMRDISAKLKSLKIDISDAFLVHFVLNSLPTEYGPFKISYNTHKENWSMNELLTMCVQEEERLKHEKQDMKQESANLATHKIWNKKNAKFVPKLKKEGNVPMKKDGNKCFFCKKKGHMKKDCVKYKKWLEKKGNLISFVCYESLLVDVPNNTWWIDSGSTIHIVNTMQGFLSQRKPKENERFIYSGNKMGSQVEAVGTFRLVLESGFVLDLENTFYVPSFSRNLVSVSRLVTVGFSFLFENSTFSLFKNKTIVGYGSLVDGLYKFRLDPTYECNHSSLHSEIIGMKRSIYDENSYSLWHKRLCHISIDRIKRLINDGVLKTLDFSDSGTCLSCIKGKQTNKTTKGANRSSGVLEIIHTDICGPFSTPCLNGQKYFISFIDDFTRYMYLYLLHDKSEALDVFKIYKADVEKQIEKKIKLVKYDRGKE